jgi:flagellar motor switch/type III secretory pathway protein FliN
MSAIQWMEADAPGIVPLRLRSAATCDAWCDAVRRVLEEWSTAWALEASGGDPPKVDILEVAPAIAAVPTQWHVVRTASGERLWCALIRMPDTSAAKTSRALLSEPLQPGDVLRRALFQVAGTAAAAEYGETLSLADELAHAAWLDWCDRLAALAGASPCVERPARAIWPASSELPPEILRPWGGALMLGLRWAGAQLRLVASSEFLDRWLRGLPAAAGEPAAKHPARESLASIQQALDASPSRLSIELAPMEMDLGALTSLRVGDVVRTTHRLDSALQVHWQDPASRATHVPLCEAFLGRQGDYRVAELLPSTTHLPTD